MVMYVLQLGFRTRVGLFTYDSRKPSQLSTRLTGPYITYHSDDELVLKLTLDEGNMCCKTTTAKGNEDLDKAVTTPTQFCMRDIFLPGWTCPPGWVRFAIRFQNKSGTLDL